MKTISLLLLASITLAHPAYAEVYRWTDSNGKVHYSDAPPDNNSAEKRRLGDQVEKQQYIPYETRQAQQKFPVTMYFTANCGDICKQATQYLNDKKIPFQSVELKTPEEVKKQIAESGSSVTPTLKIGRNYLAGFKEDSWQQELKAAGYPMK